MVLISCSIDVVGILCGACKLSIKNSTFAHYDSTKFIKETAMKCLLIE